MSEAPCPPVLPEVAGASSSRTLKRRFSSSGDLAFFTPTSTSFNPKPFSRSIASSHTFGAPKCPPVNSHPSHLAQPIPVMDPSPSDPNAVFIRPPFVDFPNSHLYPEGLSYTLMAANPEWFLDQNDFISSISTNPNAIPYPPQLEPPRGWCPAKKKDLKALGPDGWPEGEEPRLRCTFCRRTYAGVNAKSMWRRHVYEKHKIAMSNRRDNNDRTRSGRGAHKDQRQGTSDKENVSDGHRRASKASELDTTKTKARSLLATSDACSANVMEGYAEQPEVIPTPSAPLIEQREFPPPDQLISEGAQLLQDDGVHASSTEPSLIKPRSRLEAEDASSPKLTYFSVPLSPYDPTLTPSFRHSPPRLPSDQPWRFPSPSHPLHSKAREICLSMLVRGGASPLVKSDPTTQSAQSSSPSIINTPCSVTTRSRVVGDLGPMSIGSSPIIFRPSPRQLFTDGASPIPAFNRLDYRKSLNDSPLGGGLRRRSHLRKRSTMNPALELQGGWLSDASLSSASSSMGVGSPPGLSHEDPFGTLCRPLLGPRAGASSVDRRCSSTPESSDATGSPVVRNARLSDVGAPELEAGIVGLGIGLMAPFTLSTPRSAPDNAMNEGIDGVDVGKSLVDARSPNLTRTNPCDDLQDAPPLKKRRKTLDEGSP